MLRPGERIAFPGLICATSNCYSVGRSMPRAPKKCADHQCETRVVGKRYCPEHTTVNWQREGTPRTATAEHKAWRSAVLARDKGQCKIRGPRCTYRATEADHILAEAFGGTTTLDNGQAACSPCHRDKTQQEAAEGRRQQRAAYDSALG
ncbi:HNH endonuclease [Arthrobacter sp. SX1312]|uniref:HNH endonuclease n=1 Tax=Arthrobacter sp. SX1312 TaxID=2058896 RepID=UPI0034D684CA